MEVDLEVVEMEAIEDVVEDMIQDLEVEVVSGVDVVEEAHVMEEIVAAAMTGHPMGAVVITEVLDTEADHQWVREMAATGKGSRSSSIAIARTAAARMGANHQLPDLRCL